MITKKSMSWSKYTSRRFGNFKEHTQQLHDVAKCEKALDTTWEGLDWVSRGGEVGGGGRGWELLVAERTTTRTSNVVSIASS